MHSLPCFVICICYPVFVICIFLPCFVACLVICICYPLVLGGGGKGVGSVGAIQCFIRLFCLADLVGFYFRYNICMNCLVW